MFLIYLAWESTDAARDIAFSNAPPLLVQLAVSGMSLSVKAKVRSFLIFSFPLQSLKSYYCISNLMGDSTELTIHLYSDPLLIHCINSMRMYFAHDIATLENNPNSTDGFLAGHPNTSLPSLQSSVSDPDYISLLERSLLGVGPAQMGALLGPTPAAKPTVASSFLSPSSSSETFLPPKTPFFMPDDKSRQSALADLFQQFLRFLNNLSRQLHKLKPNLPEDYSHLQELLLHAPIPAYPNQPFILFSMLFGSKPTTQDTYPPSSTCGYVPKNPHLAHLLVPQQVSAQPDFRFHIAAIPPPVLPPNQDLILHQDDILPYLLRARVESAVDFVQSVMFFYFDKEESTNSNGEYFITHILSNQPHPRDLLYV